MDGAFCVFGADRQQNCQEIHWFFTRDIELTGPTFFVQNFTGFVCRRHSL